MAKKIVIEKEVLINLYINEGKSIRKISDELGYTTFVIHTNLKDHNLNRNMSEAQKLKCKREGVHNQFELDGNLLKELYLNENLNSYEIAEKLKCSQYKVWKTLKDLKINRNVSEVMKGREPWNKGKDLSESHKEQYEKLSKQFKGREGYWKGKVRSDKDKIKMSESHTGKKISDETKGKMSKSHLGKKKSNKHKKNMRLGAIKRINNNLLNGNQVIPNYNPGSIQYIEKYGKEHGYNFKHAENGGEFYIQELGYWVDGYDSSKNVVLEFNEEYPNLLESVRGNNRKKEIMEHLGCRFIILNNNGNEILNTK